MVDDMMPDSKRMSEPERGPDEFPWALALGVLVLLIAAVLYVRHVSRPAPPAPQPVAVQPADESCLRGQTGIIQRLYTEKVRLGKRDDSWAWETAVSFEMPDKTILSCRYDYLKYDAIWKPGMVIRDRGGIRTDGLSNDTEDEATPVEDANGNQSQGE